MSGNDDRRDDELPVGPRVEYPEQARPPAPTRLVGRRHELRPVDAERDAEPLYAASHGDARREALWTYLLNAPFDSLESMRAWLVDCAVSPDVVFFTVVQRQSQRPVGMAAFQRFEPRGRCVEIAHVWYGPDYQRSGANTEATYLMLKEAFEGMGCRRVEWKCDALNARSRAAAERMGFHFEGLFRQHMIIKGRNRDTAWFSMIDAEWPTVRSNMERALESDGALSLAELTRAGREA